MTPDPVAPSGAAPPSGTARTVVVTQSNYLPWRGWFDMLRRADALVILDSVQYTKRDWRNRNRIKAPNGPAWLTVPVEVKGRFAQGVDETRITAPGWAREHLRSITLAYKKAPHFAAVFPWLEAELLAADDEPLLTRVNERLLRALLARLGITIPVARDADLLPRDALVAMDASERLAALAAAAGATAYLSGPAAKAYMDAAPFERRGIGLRWMDYAGYPDYPQLWGPFEPALSVVDLLLNAGDDAPRLLGAPRPVGAL